LVFGLLRLKFVMQYNLYIIF